MTFLLNYHLAAKPAFTGLLNSEHFCRGVAGWDCEKVRQVPNDLLQATPVSAILVPAVCSS
jgi:hypothetical protein